MKEEIRVERAEQTNVCKKCLRQLIGEVEMKYPNIKRGDQRAEREYNLRPITDFSPSTSMPKPKIIKNIDLDHSMGIFSPKTAPNIIHPNNHHYTDESSFYFEEEVKEIKRDDDFHSNTPEGVHIQEKNLSSPIFGGGRSGLYQAVRRDSKGELEIVEVKGNARKKLDKLHEKLESPILGNINTNNKFPQKSKGDIDMGDMESTYLENVQNPQLVHHHSTSQSNSAHRRFKLSTIHNAKQIKSREWKNSSSHSRKERKRDEKGSSIEIASDRKIGMGTQRATSRGDIVQHGTQKEIIREPPDHSPQLQKLSHSQMTHSTSPNQTSINQEPSDSIPINQGQNLEINQMRHKLLFLTTVIYISYLPLYIF